MRRPNRRIIVPAILAALGTWLLVGCIYIPTFGTTVRGRNAGGEVGAAASRKPVRVAGSTLADAIRVLGEPPQATADRRVVAYPWTVRNGIFVWPLCFTGASAYGRRTLVLRFDERHVLQSFQILKNDETLFTLDGGAGMLLLPPEIERERASEFRRRAVLRPPSPVAATVPATVPVHQPE
jgi:hypothetical protein